MKLRDSKAYLSGLARAVGDYRAEIAKYPPKTEIHWLSLATTFNAWRASLSGGASPIGDERPWLTFGAIRCVERLLRPGARVFEYGAGGSTLFFLNRGASVVTVDHDPQWLERVASVVRKKGYKDWTPLVKPPIPSELAENAAADDPDGYVSSGHEFRGCSFEAYAAAIDPFENESFDWVMVDGRARPSCGKHARPKIKEGGYLILDNSERATYAWIHDELSRRGWKTEHFYGPGPYNHGFWQTSVFHRSPSTPQ